MVLSAIAFYLPFKYLSDDYFANVQVNTPGSGVHNNHLFPEIVIIGLLKDEAKGKLFNRVKRCSHDFWVAFTMVKFKGCKHI